MTTSFGEFQDENGVEYYFTTSQGSGRTYLCQGDDTRVIIALDRTGADRMLECLSMAIIYAFKEPE